jgi:hypothetical protein
MSNEPKQIEEYPNGCYFKLRFPEGGIEKGVEIFDSIFKEHNIAGKPKDWGKETDDGERIIGVRRLLWRNASLV